MSKSAPDDAPGVVRMLDGADVIRRKVRRAVTDSDGELRYDPVAKPGLANLAELLAAITGDSPAEVVAATPSYRALKDACVEAIDAELAPIRRRHGELVENPEELRRRLDLGARRAAAVADLVLHRARRAIGIGISPNGVGVSRP